jgi:hypothetical protein
MTPLAKINLGAFSLLLIGAVVGIWYLCAISDADRADYKEMLTESRLSALKGTFGGQPAYQIRETVQKDLWSGAERLHFRMQSAGSELMLVQKKRHQLEAVETLQGMDCWIQEEIDPIEGRQRLRRFSSAHGAYFFPAHCFAAEAVQLSLFDIPGLDLPVGNPTEEPYLIGSASEVNFSLSHKLPTFKAHILRAKVDL